ncbi:uncharacterized protein LACBIDRAFT_317706 [Laccaria bicolor S238N-H82]|uniref:Predicted protein n=1 Tax=Laccaria bicolor (strain S238N-H82 / ATCC MYA-4686) TaxID=486041 RepID=B0E283_LACBS|nr:uncharacterized protein LACBIDRAFT_317706 [Laccaria bicolor S238N-H82]EDQ99060.1 predicted protein [Laccaria bicolor S238N-H82]|eukprot:XP_001890303.1 predicted protein [Laccaria bicolor S238N-H82]
MGSRPGSSWLLHTTASRDVNSVEHDTHGLRRKAFGRQLKRVIRLWNPLVIRTHEAEADT